MRGQATVEYLVLLAVAMIVAVTIIAFTTDWIPGAAMGLKERQARMYWKSMTPLAIEDWKISPTPIGAVFDIKNVGENQIELNEICAGGSCGTISGSLLPGEKKQFSTSMISCAASGVLYTLDNVSIKYDVVGGIQDQIERGDRPLIGRCA